MGREDRKKASELFAEARLVFAEKVPFGTAFPQIEEATVLVEQTGKDARGGGRSVYRYGPPLTDGSYRQELGEFVNCHNSICYGGGVSIGEIIRGMVREQKTELKTDKSCLGYEGSPNGGKRYRSCINSFQIEVTIRYKPPSAPPPAG